jgi:hypothetical protein
MNESDSRRHFLQTVLAASAVGLAGCGGNDAGDGSDEPTDGGEGGDGSDGDSGPTPTVTPDGTLTPTSERKELTPTPTPGESAESTPTPESEPSADPTPEPEPTPTPTPSAGQVADLSGSGNDLAKFGNAVAVSGDTAIVGEHEGDAGATDSGRVYVFGRSDGGWSRQATLTPDDPQEYGGFGVSVALDGDRALIGARGYDAGEATNRGAAYVFERTGDAWQQTARLDPEGAAPGDEFGVVALQGDTAVVGAPNTDSTADSGGDGGTATRTATASGERLPDTGAAYVFARSGGGWTQQATLTASDGDADDRFGSSVAFDGDTAVVAAVAEEDPNGAQSGAAYAFEERDSGWQQVAKLLPDDGASDAEFGSSVAVDGNAVLVGARGATTDGASGAGAAYVFRQVMSREGTTDWVQSTRLAGDGDPDDGFGTAVALHGETAVVGAPGDDVGGALGAGELGGAAYLFRYGNEWTREARFTIDDRGQYELLGSSVAVTEGTAVAGAPGVDRGRTDDIGAAYVYRV